MTPDHALEAAEELLFGHREEMLYTAEEQRMILALSRAILRDSSATVFVGMVGSA